MDRRLERIKERITKVFEKVSKKDASRPTSQEEPSQSASKGETSKPTAKGEFFESACPLLHAGEHPDEHPDEHPGEYSGESSDESSYYNSSPSQDSDLPRDHDGWPTVGVEWEFHYAYLWGDGPDPHAEIGKHRKLIKVDRQKDIMAAQEEVFGKLKGALEVFPPAQRQIALELPGSPSFLGPQKTSFLEYVLKNDFTVIRIDQESPYEYIGIEVNSPKLESQDPRLYEQLAMTTRGLRATQRVMVDNACGLHVHVGVHGDNNFSLPALQKLATVLWLGETRLNGLCHPDRDNSRYCQTFTKNSVVGYSIPLAMKYLSGKDRNPFASWFGPVMYGEGAVDTGLVSDDLFKPLSILWRAASKRELALLLGANNGNLAFSFQKFKFPKEDMQQTVEFRRMAGTLDPDVVAAWATVCAQIVLRCKNYNFDEFQDVCRNLLRPEEEYDVFHFLEGLYGGFNMQKSIKTLRRFVEVDR